MRSEAHRLLGTPQPGGVLIVCDHASNRVPDDLDLDIPPECLEQHIAIDIGVAAVAERMVRPGIAAWLGNISRLVCDFNRNRDVPGIVPEASDGHVIPGNVLDAQGREARIARFFDPYHAGLSRLLDTVPPALILSLHSFTPRLASDPDQQRPWQVGVLYNADDRAARIAMPLLEAEGLAVGDQQPYSGKVLNATMNRHAEGRCVAYLGIEIRQDEIAGAPGQAIWAERLRRICSRLTTPA